MGNRCLIPTDEALLRLALEYDIQHFLLLVLMTTPEQSVLMMYGVLTMDENPKGLQHSKEALATPFVVPAYWLAPLLRIPCVVLKMLDSLQLQHSIKSFATLLLTYWLDLSRTAVWFPDDQE